MNTALALEKEIHKKIHNLPLKKKLQAKLFVDFLSFSVDDDEEMSTFFLSPEVKKKYRKAKKEIKEKKTVKWSEIHRVV
ncbi:MAG: hypothetical protein HQM15_09455 [Deltaproteobacteria bacterium]|nr:hypothetical protein [Deltaproteobacteria bacterium]